MSQVDPADRAAASEVLARYADAIDDGDFDAVGELLADAVVEDDRGRPIARGAAAVSALYRATTRRHADGTPRTAHLVTNVVVDRDGDDLVVRSRFVVLQATGAVPLQPVVAGRYVDRMRRIDGRWRIVVRRMHPQLWGDVSDHLLIDPT